MTYYEWLNYFFELAKERKLNASVQLVFLHILHEWNRLRHPECFAFRQSEIANYAGVTRQTVQNSLTTLRNYGLLQTVFETGRPMQIKLPTGQVDLQVDSRSAASKPVVSVPELNTYNRKNENETRARSGERKPQNVSYDSVAQMRQEMKRKAENYKSPFADDPDFQAWKARHPSGELEKLSAEILNGCFSKRNQATPGTIEPCADPAQVRNPSV